MSTEKKIYTHNSHSSIFTTHNSRFKKNLIFIPNKNYHKMKRYIPVLLIALLLSSCNSYKKLTYLQDIGKAADTLYLKKKTEYRLQPADILYVRIITLDEETNRLFNPFYGTRSTTDQIRVESMYFFGYEVNDSGNIELPILNKIHVSGLTINEAKEKIQKYAEEYLKEPMTIVKLHTFKFTILGEVKSPGVKEFGAHQINLMEALALGGDITYNGNRESILILRANQDNNKAFRVDITNKDLVNSEFYYIQPNDVIYVEPLKTTLFRERTSDYLYFVTSFTSVLITLLLIISLL